MTDNLRAKINELLQQGEQHHTTVVSALNAIVSRLDTLITLSGGAPPSNTVTLADLLNVLSDIHSDTISMDGKLLNLRDGLVLDEPTTGFTVQSQMGLLRARFEQAFGFIGTHSPYPVLQLLLESREGIQAVLNSIGLPTGDATTTVLGLMLAILRCGCYGIPSSPDTQLCGEDAFISLDTGRVDELVPTGGSGGVGITHNAAVWGIDAPGNLTTSSDMDIGGGYVLIYSPDWTKWRVWVKSPASSYSDVFPPVTYYAVGQWRSLTGEGTKLFTTFYGNTIEVTLCPVDGGGENGGTERQCWTLESQPVSVTPAYGDEIRQMAIIPLQPLMATITWSNGSATTSPQAIHQGDYAGWEFRYISGSCRVVWGIQGGDIYSHFIHSAADNFFLPSGYDYVIVDDSEGVENEQGFGPFTIEICEPLEV